MTIRGCFCPAKSDFRPVARQRWREDSGPVAIPLNYSLLLTSNGEV
jgi:hypothetical protein